jgi:2-desacetyl-2-hydroxyethyl bacteriochlorophyllide A dehydrogenase
MKAAVLRRMPSTDLDVCDVPRPALRRTDELLVRVEACGICGTDVHLMAGESFRPDLPFILGHEPVGEVIAAGSPELEPWIGTRVTATIFVGCGQCAMCRADDERLCAGMREITGLFVADGGYADYLRLRVTQVVELPRALPSEVAAALVDAGPTAVNAVRAARARNSAEVVVVGAGSVGFLCAELLRLAGLAPAVVEPNPLRRDALRRVGHHVVADLDELQAAPDAVIDCSAAPGVVPWALDHVAPRGVFVAVGFQTVPSLELIPVVRKEIAIVGVRSGSRLDLMRVLDLAATHRIRVPGITTWPLEEINDALAHLRDGRIEGKAVIQVRSRSG